MFDPILDIRARSKELANHYQAHLALIQQKSMALKDLLEKAGLLAQVNLFNPSTAYSREMDVISDLVPDKKSKIVYLSTYYALQFILLNLFNLTILRSNTLKAAEQDRSDKIALYEDFMRRMGEGFRKLSVAYMRHLLAAEEPELDCDRFVIMSVGAKADQDDIDIAVMDDGSSYRLATNKLLIKLREYMMRYATPLHFYLAEQFDSSLMTASLPEYRKAMKTRMANFVVISEILSATYIIGNVKLFQQFERHIARRYYCLRRIGGRLNANKPHEGFLRGILGELRSLVSRPERQTTLHPKEDGLRVIKGLIYALKTVFNIDKTYSWDILKEIRSFDPGNDHLYDQIYRGLTFLETFRLIYQVLVSQDEEIFLDEPVTGKNLQRVAKAMGYRDLGHIKAKEHLLVDYYGNVGQLKRVIRYFLAEMSVHLQRIGPVNAILRGIKSGESRNRMFRQLSRTIRQYQGAKYWDDFIRNITSEDFHLLSLFIAEYGKQHTQDKEKIIKFISRFGLGAIHSFIKLLHILHEYPVKDERSKRLFHSLNDHFIRYLGRSVDYAFELIKVFHSFPGLIHRYLACQSNEHLARLMDILQRCDVYEREVASVKHLLVKLVSLNLYGSYYFKRFLHAVFSKYPHTIRFLRDSEKIGEFSSGIYSRITFSERNGHHLRLLGDYFDLEFVRIGINLLDQKPLNEINRQFTMLSDSYLKSLFNFCKSMVEQELQTKITTEDTLGIFVSGGHAREQAFEDDYDLIILLDSSDLGLKQECAKILSKMNREIIRRAILPQYRFMDYFGEYVTTFRQLRDLLGKRRPGRIVDQSQLLGARLVLGSKILEGNFFSSIIEPCILADKQVYVANMAREILERARVFKDMPKHFLNIKEQPGGIRDIEMFF